MLEDLRNVNSYESVLFYISIENPKKGEKIFNSSNLHGGSLPDVKGKHKFSADAAGLGSLRINEFLLPPYDVTVATSARNSDTAIRAYALTSIALVLAMLVASIIIGLGMSQIVLRPIRSIRETADRIRSDNLSERIPVSTFETNFLSLPKCSIGHLIVWSGPSFKCGNFRRRYRTSSRRRFHFFDSMPNRFCETTRASTLTLQSSRSRKSRA